MSEYNVLIQQKNNSGSYDKIYPIPNITQVTVTLDSQLWDNNDYYSFESTYPSSTYAITVSVADTATSIQFDAFIKAKLVGSNTTNRIKYTGTKPTVNIPVILRLERVS